VRALALEAALLAAWVIPGAPPGIGVALVALLLATAAASTAPRTRDLLQFGSAALVLASFTALLDARWVVAVDLTAAWFFATLAVGGIRLRALAAPFAVLPTGLPTLVPQSWARAIPALRALALGTVVTVPFAVLFLTADAAFATIVDDSPVRRSTRFPGGWSRSASSCSLYLGSRWPADGADARSRAGRDVRGATLVARPRNRIEEVLLRALLGLLCALTIVILVSALHRLRLYESAFGLTRTRIAAEAFALWLGGTFGLLLLLDGLRRARNRPRIVLGWAALALVVFSLADPDGRIADRNVERWRETGRIDLAYASNLSADAAPELSRLPAQLRRQVLGRIAENLAHDEPLSSANLSRARARRVIRRTLPPTTGASLSGSRHPRPGSAAGSLSGP
jgi:hypothetical protein